MSDSTTNGAGAGLQLRDWLAEPETSAEQLPVSEPNRPQPQPRPSTPATAATERQRRQAVSDAALVVPDLVRLQLDTALFGDRSPHGSADRGRRADSADRLCSCRADGGSYTAWGYLRGRQPGSYGGL
jgi:hypothetical protein